MFVPAVQGAYLRSSIRGSKDSYKFSTHQYECQFKNLQAPFIRSKVLKT